MNENPFSGSVGSPNPGPGSAQIPKVSILEDSPQPQNNGTVSPVPLRPEIAELDRARLASLPSQAPSVAAPLFGTQQITEDEVQRKAKNLLPICKKLVALLDSTGVRAVNKAGLRAGYTQIELEEDVLPAVAMDDETKDLLNTSSSRLAARYVKNEETMDWAGLVSGLTTWASGMLTAIREFKNTRQPAIRVNKPATAID